MLRAVPLCRPLPGLGPGFCLHGKWADLGTRGPSVRTSPLPGSSVCWSHLSTYGGQPLLSVPHDSFGVSTFSVHFPSAVEQMEFLSFSQQSKLQYPLCLFSVSQWQFHLSFLWFPCTLSPRNSICQVAVSTEGYFLLWTFLTCRLVVMSPCAGCLVRVILWGFCFCRK